MKNSSKAVLLEIFISSSDKLEHEVLYEHIVFKAKKEGLAGSSVQKGMLGFGASSVVHSYKFWEVTEKVPTVVQIIDEKDKILDFIETIDPILLSMKYGCLVTTQEVNVELFKAGRSNLSEF